MRSASLTAMVAALVAGCSARLPQPPRPESVDPASGRQDVETPITIHGRDFYLDAHASYVDRERSRLESTFRARLGDTELGEVAYVDFNTLTAVVPAGLEQGSHDLTVEDPAGRTGTLPDAFTVLLPERKMVIEDAPGGTGSEVLDEELEVDQTLVLFAVVRLQDGSFVRDAEASWSVSGEIGSLEPASGSRTVLTAIAVGTGAVRADVEGLTGDETGAITVSSCSSDAECADACHTSAVCTDGECSLGEVDRDADGDGLIDVACPGGDDCDDDNPNCGADCTDRDGDGFCSTHDCDDDPDACGAECYPENGAPDVCDGHDQDCDGETDEDPDISWYRDADGDGYGGAGDEISSCNRPEGFVEDATDCADGAESDPACNGLNGSQCHPGVAGDDCDGADNDCDGDIDEDYTPAATVCGRGACTASGELRCIGGEEQDTCAAGSPAADDSACNNQDDDCDGDTDEDYVETATFCGVGACAGNSGNLICSAGVPTDTCDPMQNATVDDAICNNQDDDCDGGTDEDYVVTPSPICGTGECAGNTGEIVCLDGVETSTCNPTQGAVEESEPADNCSDLADNDCDGLTDGDDDACLAMPNRPPVVDFFVDPPVGTTAITFQADASASTDAEDGTGSLIFLWDWDNDGVTDGEGVTSSHVFSTDGAHTVVLMVEDTGGLRAWATFEVTVSPADELVVVTTEIDEADGGATPASPGGGGFSLREAIIYANGRPGKQTIQVPSGYGIDLTSALPPPTDGSGLDIVADGAALNGAGAAGDCLSINVGNNRIFGLEVFDCPGRAITISGGTDNRVARCYIHDNGDGIQLGGTDNILGPDNELARNGARGVKMQGPCLVEWNRIHEHSDMGISLMGQADGSTVRGNVIYANGNGIEISGPAVANVLVQNTIHANLENGVYVGNNITGTDFRNNILSYNGLWGVNGGSANFAIHDYNDYYLNGSGACSDCAALGPNSLTDDPLYVNAAGYDLRLRGDSTLIDRGAILPGLDVNRAEPGDYNGSGPDIGAWESP